MDSNLMVMINSTQGLLEDMGVMNNHLVNASDLTAYLLRNLYEVCVVAHPIDEGKCFPMPNTTTNTNTLNTTPFNPTYIKASSINENIVFSKQKSSTKKMKK